MTAKQDQHVVYVNNLGGEFTDYRFERVMPRDEYLFTCVSNVVSHSGDVFDIRPGAARALLSELVSATHTHRCYAIFAANGKAVLGFCIIRFEGNGLYDPLLKINVLRVVVSDAVGEDDKQLMYDTLVAQSIASACGDAYASGYKGVMVHVFGWCSNKDSFKRHALESSGLGNAMGKQWVPQPDATFELYVQCEALMDFGVFLDR